MEAVHLSDKRKENRDGRQRSKPRERPDKTTEPDRREQQFTAPGVEKKGQPNGRP